MQYLLGDMNWCSGTQGAAGSVGVRRAQSARAVSVPGTRDHSTHDDTRRAHSSAHRRLLWPCNVICSIISVIYKALW